MGHDWAYNYNAGGASYVGRSESGSAGSKLGIDLPLAGGKKYTVELGASSSKLVEDP